MKKSLKQRFIDYMNKPFKKRGAGEDLILCFFVSFCCWTFFWFITVYVAILAMCAIFLIPIQLIVGLFK